MVDEAARKELHDQLTETAEALAGVARGIGLGKMGRAAHDMREAAAALQRAADAVQRL